MFAAYLRPHSRRPRRRPVLESLEDRCLLSNYTITDLGAGLNPTALNNNGQVAGNTFNSSGSTGAFLWSNGTLTTLSGIGAGAEIKVHNTLSGA